MARLNSISLTLARCKYILFAHAEVADQVHIDGIWSSSGAQRTCVWPTFSLSKTDVDVCIVSSVCT